MWRSSVRNQVIASLFRSLFLPTPSNDISLIACFLMLLQRHCARVFIRAVITMILANRKIRMKRVLRLSSKRVNYRIRFI